MVHLNIRTFAAAGALVLSVSVFAMGGRPKGDEESANKRIAPVARVELAAPVAAASGDRSGEQIYKAVCGACHDAAVAGAPKLGDKAAWAPRLAAGVDGLTASAIKGKGAMPPKGGVAAASDADIKAVVAYMVGTVK
jgi:cytochrome c5